MKKLIYLMSLALVVLTFTACKKEVILSNNIEDTIHIRNGKSDMPAFIRGNGESKVFILLLHGGPGDGGLKYRNHTFSKLLEEKYAVVYWDQRHQGNSHGHLSESDVSIAEMVEDTYYVVKTLKQRYGEDISLFLFGHSWGGTLGTAFMLKENYQSEISGWIESGGAHDFQLINTEQIKMIQKYSALEIDKGNNVAKWTEMIVFINSIDQANISLEEMIELNSYAGICEKLIAEIESPTSSELGQFESLFLTPNNPMSTALNDVQLPKSLQEELINTSYTNELHKINTPTLLLWGKYDFKVPKTIGEKALEKIGTNDKYLHILEKSGHSSMRYEPEAFTNHVINFIETHK